MLGKYMWPPHQAIERSQDVQDSLVAGALGVVLRQDLRHSDAETQPGRHTPDNPGCICLR